MILYVMFLLNMIIKQKLNLFYKHEQKKLFSENKLKVNVVPKI